MTSRAPGLDAELGLLQPLRQQGVGKASCFWVLIGHGLLRAGGFQAGSAPQRQEPWVRSGPELWALRLLCRCFVGVGTWRQEVRCRGNTRNHAARIQPHSQGGQLSQSLGKPRQVCAGTWRDTTLGLQGSHFGVAPTLETAFLCKPEGGAQAAPGAGEV